MRKIYAGAVLFIAAVTAQAAVIDFDDNALAPDSYFDPQADTVWSSGGADFNHGWNETFNCCWDGFTYSNSTDTTTACFLNDRSAITGDGVGAGQDNYAVGYTGAGTATIDFGAWTNVRNAYFTNATYTYLAMTDGNDGNTPAFVKGPFEDGDWFDLTIYGLGSAGETISSLTIRLADGANVLDTWKFFDLRGLGEVYGLNFSLDSSDQGDFGMNTPAYFAMDSMSVVPVPAAVWLFVSALGALGLRRKVKA